VVPSSPSDRSRLYEGSRYRMGRGKSTPLSADGRPRPPQRTAPSAVSSELIDPGGELVAIEPQVVLRQSRIRLASGPSGLRPRAGLGTGRLTFECRLCADPTDLRWVS
jgi:hypothetical protein